MCRDICLDYKALKPPTKFRYLAGQKRCSRCAVFIYFNGFNCPCCGYKLRSRPVQRKCKAKWRMGLAEAPLCPN